MTKRMVTGCIVSLACQPLCVSGGHNISARRDSINPNTVQICVVLLGGQALLRILRESRKLDKLLESGYRDVGRDLIRCRGPASGSLIPDSIERSR